MDTELAEPPSAEATRTSVAGAGDPLARSAPGDPLARAPGSKPAGGGAGPAAGGRRGAATPNPKGGSSGSFGATVRGALDSLLALLPGKPAASGVTTGKVSGSAVFLRPRPGSKEHDAQLGRGAPVVIRDRVRLPEGAKNPDWLGVAADGKTGWMATEFVQPDPGAKLPSPRAPSAAEAPEAAPGAPSAAAPTTGGDALAPSAQAAKGGGAKGALDFTDPATLMGKLWSKGQFKQRDPKNLIGRTVIAALADSGVIAAIRKQTVYAKAHQATWDALSDQEFLEKAQPKGKSLFNWFGDFNCVVFTQFLTERATEITALEAGKPALTAFESAVEKMLTEHWITNMKAQKIHVGLSLQGPPGDAKSQSEGLMAQANRTKADYVDEQNGVASKTNPTVAVSGKDPKEVATRLRSFNKKNAHIRCTAGKGKHSYLGYVDGDKLKCFDQNQAPARSGTVDISENPDTSGTWQNRFFYEGANPWKDESTGHERVAWVSFSAS